MCSKPKVNVTEAPPPAAPAAPAAPQAPQTAQTAQTAAASEEGSLTKRKRAGRNSLRIDANVAGDNGAGGNGLNIPR